jgi:hypothetical protein
MFGSQDCTNAPNETSTDAGVAGAGVWLYAPIDNTHGDS